MRQRTVLPILLFDVPRFIRVIGVPARLANAGWFKDVIGRRLADGLIGEADGEGFDKVEIRSVCALEAGEYVVIARITHDGGAVSWWRCWFVKGDGIVAWSMYDMEDLETATRLSARTRLAVRAVESGPRVPPARGKAVEAMEAFVRGDLAGARACLASIQGPLTPPAQEALRRMVSARLELAAGRFDAALKHIEDADRLNPHMPMALLARGVALAGLKRHREAAVALEAYRGLMGGDAEVCRLLGDCYRELRRSKEAAREYRLALDFDAKQADLLRDLLFLLAGTDDEGGDVAGRLCKLADPKGFYTANAPEAEKNADPRLLRWLLDGMRRIDPTLPELLYEDAVAKAGGWEAAKAVELYKKALAGPGNRAARAGWPDGFFKALLMGEAPELAYQVKADKREAFHLVAAELYKRRRAALPELVRQYEQVAPDDPMLLPYRGALLKDDKPDRAVEAFATAAAKLPREALAPFCKDRVQALYQCGRWREAYEDVPPAAEAFRHLSRWLARECIDDFTELVTAHRRRSPGASELLPAECILLVRQGKTDEACKMLPKALAAEQGPGDRESWLYCFLNEMRLQGRTVEGYLAAPDTRRAFGLLTMSVINNSGPWPWLPPLLAAHNKRVPDDPDLPWAEAAQLTSSGDLAGAASVLERGWMRFESMRQGRWPEEVATALVRAGRVARAVTIDPWSPQALSFWLRHDRKGAELLLLAAFVRDRYADEAELMEGRAWLLLRRQDRALASVARLMKGDEAGVSRAKELAGECAVEGVPLVLCVGSLGGGPDALHAVGDALIKAGRQAEAVKLVELVRGEGTAAGAALLARVYRQRGDARQTRWHFNRLPSKARREHAEIEAWLAAAEGWAFRFALENRGTRDTFGDVYRACEECRDGLQLRALLPLERRLHPNRMESLLTEAKARCFSGDHDGAVRFLVANREVPRRPNTQYEGFDELLVRSLVRAGRIAEAVREAEELDRRRRWPLALLLLAHAANGDVEKCMAVVERGRTSLGFFRHLYEDPDIAPLIQGEKFAPLRAKYPPSKGGR